MHGGKRPGAGRKPGSLNKRSDSAIVAAIQSGGLPHQILLKICQGYEIDGYKPTFSERMEAAKAAAPYYAAKLAAVTIEANIDDRRTVRDYSNEELLRIIQRAEEERTHND